MKTSKVDPAQFALKFGVDKVGGNSSYYLTSDGIGIVKNLDDDSLEFLSDGTIDIESISEEDQFQMLSSIHTQFKEDKPHIPSSYSEDFFEQEEIPSPTKYILSRIGAGIVVLILIYILLPL